MSFYDLDLKQIMKLNVFAEFRIYQRLEGETIKWISVPSSTGNAI